MTGRRGRSRGKRAISSHDDRIALREDLERVRRYLLSREPPFKGARALAVFCSSRADLFEVIQISRPVEGRVAIEPGAYVEPLLVNVQARNWCVALVNRREGRIFTGAPDELHEREQVTESTFVEHEGGGSQASYQRSVEQDVDHHLRNVADRLHRAWRAERFERLAVGGPQEIVPRFEAMLQDDLRACLAGRVADVDINTATDDQVRSAVAALAEEQEREHEREALDRLAAGLGSGSRAAGGAQDTLEALNERRVETLLLENGIDRQGGRCPTCGMLTLETHGNCPADGTPLAEVEHLREAMVESALVQDAEVIVVRRYPDLGAHQGIAALLRF